MKVITLLENTVCREGVQCAHGLSNYIETDRHKLLFDMGPNAMFLENAEALGVDIKAVDTAFLSHAHNDHCGGLELFCKRNDHAPVYLNRRVWGEYYAIAPGRCAYIGMDKALKKYEERFRFVDGHTVIDDELQLFSGGMGRVLWSHANDSLHEKVGETFVLDRFDHEQDLIVTEGDKAVLFAGCAHNGIVNILTRAEELLGRAPDAVFGGFHLFSGSLHRTEPRETVEAVARELMKRKNTVFYTGHCTGQEAFDWMKAVMGEQLRYMAGGGTVEIG